MNRYLVVNIADPNSDFEVEGEDVGDAAFAALEEIGWYISAKPIGADEEE